MVFVSGAQTLALCARDRYTTQMSRHVEREFMRVIPSIQHINTASHTQQCPWVSAELLTERHFSAYHLNPRINHQLLHHLNASSLLSTKKEPPKSKPPNMLYHLLPFVLLAAASPAVVQGTLDGTPDCSHNWGDALKRDECNTACGKLSGMLIHAKQWDVSGGCVVTVDNFDMSGILGRVISDACGQLMNRADCPSVPQGAVKFKGVSGSQGSGTMSFSRNPNMTWF